MSDNTVGSGSNDRHWVTMLILIGSLGGLVALSIVIVLSSSQDNPERSKNAQALFNALLPVFGTWVGTLLAYYFSKDNFESASKSMSEMASKVSGAEERLNKIFVRDKMRTSKDILTWPIKVGDEDKAKISEILSTFVRHDRIPMVDDKGCIIYLVYKNMLNQFLGQLALRQITPPPKSAADQTPKDCKDITFKDLLDSDPKSKELFQKSFGFVAESATLADAKRIMETVGKTLPCNDVFVTKTGQSNEPIAGWITDNTIDENLKV